MIKPNIYLHVLFCDIFFISCSIYLFFRHSYVTYQDIRGIQDFNNKTVIAVKAPPETKLEVPDPSEVCFELFLLINLKKFESNRIRIKTLCFYIHMIC